MLARVENSVGHGTLSVGFQGDYGRDIDRPAQQLADGALLLPVRGFEPFHGHLRAPEPRRSSSASASPRSSAPTISGPTRIALRPRRRAGPSSAPTSRPRTTACARSARSCSAARALEMGVDLNGRFGLEAMDDLITYDLSGEVVSTRPNVSIDNAYRNDTGLYASLDTSLTSVLSLGAGLRGDYVITQNEGGYFGDRSTSNGAASGYLALTAGSFGGLQHDRSGGARLPRSRPCRIATTAGRPAVASSPAIRTSIPRPACSSTGRCATPSRAIVWPRSSTTTGSDDLIERYQTTTDFFFFRNRGRARVRGFEVEGQAELGAGSRWTSRPRSPKADRSTTTRIWTISRRSPSSPSSARRSALAPTRWDASPSTPTTTTSAPRSGRCLATRCSTRGGFKIAGRSRSGSRRATC